MAGRELSMCGESAIRVALRAYLQVRFVSDPGSVIIEELGLCRGLVRVDMAIVDRGFHGFEIKSNRDHLARLSSQVDVYSRVLERATLVVGARHVTSAAAMIPDWWGILHYGESFDGLRFRPLRRGRKNPARDPRSLVELLWRDEALALLEARGAAKGARGKPRSVLWDKLCELLDLEEIGSTVRASLKTRAATQGSA